MEERPTTNDLQPTTTEQLYRLPDGTRVMPSDIRRIQAFRGGPDSPSLNVGLRDGRYVAIPFATYEEACEARERIAADIGPPHFGIFWQRTQS